MTSSGVQHLAIIMDGNGRWAKARGLPRAMGHKAGAENLDRVMHWCRDAGIRYLTVYAFSTENWRRSKTEVSALMKLLGTYLRTKEKQLAHDGVRFRVIGRRGDLPPALQKRIARVEESTKGGEQELIVALSYGGRDEIVRAAKKFKGTTEEEFAACLDTAGIPDPDLLIRTSGELRVSNFLLWQLAYAEFYFTSALWPDFDRAEFNRALEAYAHRERRLGGR